MPTSEFRSPDQIVDDALRAELRQLLAQCTEEQQAFFHRIFPVKMFPNGIDSLPTQKLKDSIGLCQRTIRKNEEGRPADAP